MSNATVATEPHVRSAIESAVDQLRASGTWWTAEEMAAVVGRANQVFAQRGAPPWMRDLEATVAGLPEAAVTVIDKIAGDPGSVDRDWATTRIAELGDGPYVELVGTTAVAVMLRMYAECANETVATIGAPPDDAGGPARDMPDGLADIGAHIAMLDPFPGPNVARALSMVPSINQVFYTLVIPMYSVAGFQDLVWDTALSRPQVELVASRVAALNECFY